MAPIKMKKEEMCSEMVTVYLTKEDKTALKSKAYSKEMYMSTYLKLLIKEDLKKE